MRYFTGELWRKINSEDKIVREYANQEWEKRDALYSKIYDKEKKRFPVEFIRLLENDGGLHDYKINKLSMIMEDWLNRSCVVAVSDGEKEYELVFHDVTSFAVNFPILSNRKWDDMWWGYEEIGHKARSLYISVLCAFENEFSIVFKSVSINTLTENTVCTYGDGSLC